MDDLDRRIIAELRNDGRQSMRVLAARVHLSAPATAARVRRLEEAGVIRGYAARIDRRATGRLRAFVDVIMHEPRHAAFVAFVEAEERIRRCDRVSGRACYVLEIEAEDEASLDGLLERVARFGAWQASIVIASVTAKDA